ncbi:hypothetical protein BDV93DRAFT_298423 [Ceratobasidium sp. AG-I]|nr:hypothetical protein BDV93DRAFT_298423 [Ceratobasidium sp. AG-I]
MSTITSMICSEWTSARKQLSRALDSFDAVCKTLEASGIQPGATRESVLQEFFFSIETELPLLLHESDRLTKSLYLLKKARNSSIQHVSINRLPPELLLSIFTTAIESSRAARLIQPFRTDTSLDLANVISSVCTYWRQIALDTPALWSDIDPTRKGGLDHVALWLERSRVHSLNVRFGSAYNHDRVRELASLLGRHSSRFKQLALRSDCFLGQKMFSDACERHNAGPSAQLQSLALFAVDNWDWNSREEVDWPPKEQMDEFLRPIHTLYIRGRHLNDWASAAFQGLCRLTLVAIEDLTCHDLMGVLEASPSLRCLELSKLLVRGIPEHNTPPIILPDLETLCLHSLSTQLIRWLSRSLVPGTKGLTLSLSGFYEPGPTKGAIELNLPPCFPDRVKTLYLRSDSPIAPQLNLSKTVAFHPHLETLALKHISLDVDQAISYPCNVAHTNLHTLDLVNCRVRDPLVFRTIAFRYPIRRLRVVECQNVPSREALIRDIPGVIISQELGDFLVTMLPFD